MTEIKTNSLKAWKLAFRLYSLPGASTPVFIGMSLAWVNIQDKGHFSWLVAISSLLFALVMQIDANIINDYFDFVHGRDDKETRLGPKRACSEGWVTTSAMRKAICIVTCLGACVGLPLFFVAGWFVIIVGVLCIAGAFLYTTCLGPRGLGDVLCLIFFGVVPVCVPYYIQTGCVTMASVCVGLSVGVVIDAMMMANNYRDIPSDLMTGKRTICVMMGAKVSRIVFSLFAPLALLLNIPLAMEGYPWALILPVLTYGPLHILATRKMYKIKEGAELNSVLAFSAKNIIVYGLTTSIGILIL